MSESRALELGKGIEFMSIFLKLLENLEQSTSKFLQESQTDVATLFMQAVFNRDLENLPECIELNANEILLNEATQSQKQREAINGNIEVFQDVQKPLTAAINKSTFFLNENGYDYSEKASMSAEARADYKAYGSEPEYVNNQANGLYPNEALKDVDKKTMTAYENLHLCLLLKRFLPDVEETLGSWSTGLLQSKLGNQEQKAAVRLLTSPNGDVLEERTRTLAEYTYNQISERVQNYWAGNQNEG